MYAVTGATGQLGRLVVEALLTSVPPDEIVAAVRDPDKATDLAVRGIQVRRADYDRPETLTDALSGVDRLLLISANEVGRRVPQHRAVIDAAKAADVKLIVYTSILHCDRSSLLLAQEHQQTEAALAASGLPTALLRNGWYTENYLMGLQPALEHGALVGSAGGGRVSLAARADYAAAAAKVLTSADQAGKIYELAGDDPWTLLDLAAEISRQSGREIAYRNLPEAEYANVLRQAGIPANMAAILADADAKAGKDALLDESRALSRLIGRPTTPVSATVAAALAG